MALNYNRFAHILLYGEKGSRVIMTPRTGRKPNIEVHGLLMASDFARDFEVRIINFYSKLKLQDFNRIKITCGYVGKAALVLEGSITVAYTESPGPERVTVIKCLTANVNLLVQAACNINLEAGTRLDAVLQTLTESINKLKAGTGGVWGEPSVDGNVAALVSTAPLSWNGPVKDLMPELKKRFPDAAVTIQNNRFRAISKTTPQASTGKLVLLKYLQSPPNYNAGQVVVTAPWEPGLVPGDRIYFYQTDIGTRDPSLGGSKPRKEYGVLSVQFDFSTVGNTNKMIVTGV